MPIDKVLSRPGAPVFGLTPEALPAYYKVRSTPYVVAGPGLGAMPKNPYLAYRYNDLLANVYYNRTHEWAAGVPSVAPLYRPGGLLYKPPAPQNG